MKPRLASMKSRMLNVTRGRGEKSVEYEIFRSGEEDEIKGIDY